MPFLVATRDFYAEYLEWFKNSWRGNDPGSKPLTKDQFYKNFPDCKPKGGRWSTHGTVRS